jgi:hypothetical protein
MMGRTGGMAVPTLLRLYWWRFNGGGYAIGTFVGVAAAVAQRIWFRDMLEWQQFAYTMVLGLIGSVVGSYLTRPADPAVVENFYKKTRPFGLWEPFKKTLAPDVRETMEKEHFWDIAALPFALLWLVTIMLMPMQAMVGNWTALWITLPMFAVALAGLYHTWYKRLPPRDAG